MRFFWIEIFKSILTNKPIMIKNIPMYEFKDRSKIFSKSFNQIIAHETLLLNMLITKNLYKSEC